LATTFEFVALFLCLTGLAGVVSFTTRRRLREVALRAALGATPARLGLWLVQEAVLLTALGIAVGGVLGSWLTRSVAGLLYGVSAADPVTLALTTAGVTVGAVAASVWAVGKTIWLTPATVLRAD
jgi:ABC-type antimicrobial peptide transport system permease subunit